MPRYNLPVLAALVVIAAYLLTAILRDGRLVAALFLAGIPFSMILWHPDYAERLPAPARSVLQRQRELPAWHYELDLRFLDVVELIEWGGDEILSRTTVSGARPTVATHWPAIHALGVPEMGYVARTIDGILVDSWQEAMESSAEFVFLLEPIGYIADAPGADDRSLRLVGERAIYPLRARLWQRVEGSAAATVSR